jgi:GAF domain-containing protein
MKRRSRAGGEAIKGQRRQTSEPKRRNAPKVQPRAKLSPATEKTEVARLARELSEERKRHTATSEVLHLLSGSHGDLNRLFDAILSNATKLCQATFGALFLCEAGAFRIVAQHNAPPAYAELRRREPLARGRLLLRAAETKQVVQIADVREDVASNPADKDLTAFTKLSGVRTILVVPMLKDAEVLGEIVIYRQKVRTFNDREIELLKSFAAQAVIAIENARLLNELRQSLEQQTATSEVLQVISGSLGDLQPVFRAMLANAVKICDAKFGNLLLFEDSAFRTVAVHGAPQPYLDERTREPIIRLSPGSDLDRLVRTKQAVHVPDIRVGGMASGSAIIELANARTMLTVPMLKENDLIGAIGIYRQEVRPFADKQIELVENFAAQAVIAIENARLLNELRQRTDDLTEALEQQTATSDVLQVISSSPGDLEPVFATMLERAVRICDASFGNIYRWDGEALHLLATQNTPPAFAEALRSSPWRPHPKNVIGRMLTSKTITHIADAAASEAYAERHPATVAAVELGGIRSVLTVPLLKGNKMIGAFALARQEVRPFSDKQIELVKNFAAQAVIAIDNARLLRELRERTDQLAAQSEELAKLNQRLEQRVSDQVGEIERMSKLRRFLPPQVADLIVASGTEKQLESHRREITALFCDLRGFTGFSESADPEDVMSVLREYHEALGACIIKYSGTLERYAGDGVMVVFNDPVPVENPALQAVLMALEMRDAIGALTETWRRWGHEIGFGIGIAHGFATLGTIGFEGRFDYAAIGTVSNVASRLCDEAKPGQILISPRVLTKVENAVQVEPVGEFELKGIRRPLAAYNVVGAVTREI